MTDIDSLIDKEHAQAQKAEDDARAIIARLHSIPGISSWLAGAQKNRRHGEPPNPWAVDNLSARAAIQAHDPALASYLAGRAGKSIAAPNYAAQEAAQKRAEALHRMETETAALRAKREAQQRQRQQELIHGRWNNLLGKVV